MDDSIYKLIAIPAVIVIWWAIGRYFNKFDKRFDDQDLKFASLNTKLDAIIEQQGKQDQKLIIHAYILKRLDPSFIVHYPD